MKRNAKGVTLTEVLVSIVVLGILFATSITILTTTNNISMSNKRKLNTSVEVELIFKLFSSDPVNFTKNLEDIYNVSSLDDHYQIFYTSTFTRKNNNASSSYYLDLTYQITNIDAHKKYALVITIYHNNQIFSISGNDYFYLEIVK